MNVHGHTFHHVAIWRWGELGTLMAASSMAQAEEASALMGERVRMPGRRSFSVVLPVHNEARILPYSLPWIRLLNADELVLVFDRCSDNSVKVAEKIVGYPSVENGVTFVILKKRMDNKFPLILARRRGYALARNNLILSTSADIILDPQILRAVKLLENPKVALVGVGCVDYPVSKRNLLGNLVQHVMARTGNPRFYGPFWFKKDKWLECDEAEGYVSEDAPLWLSLLKKGEMRFVDAKCLHLRGDESRERNYYRGRDYWRVARRNALFALASSVFMLRPSLAVGYLHERLNR